MKRQIQAMARHYGYEIRKAPRPNFRSVAVFDLAIHYLLATRGPSLTFIEVGANDGVFGDPLRRYILKYPWTGVLIEPQPNVFEKLKANYAGLDGRISFENVAISNDSRPIALFRLPSSSMADTVVAATVASFNPKTAARQLWVKPSQLEQIMVPTARLDDIVAKHHLSGLDILQVDAEGFDWQVLQTLDLTKTKPLLIRFEHGHLSPAVIGDMTQHLNDHDYDLNFGGYESDSVALRRDFIQA